MDAQAIRRLEPQLDHFLAQFAECFDAETEQYGLTYLRGQLSELERKNVERIALAADLSPRTLQEFLSRYEWDHEAMRTRLQQLVAEQHADANSIGIIDETSFPKKGNKTPGVQRQHCGAVGKQDNCFVTVHLSYAAGDDFHCLLDGDLFLPESWSNDRERCRAAKIPDDLVYRSKSDIALELYRRASANGIRFGWLTFDEWYGAKPQFLSALCRERQKYVGEIHCGHRMWTKKPRITTRPYRKNGRGKSRKMPRLVAGSPKPMTSQECFETDRMFTGQAWQRWHVKDTEKGAKVVEVKRGIVYPQDENKLPMEAHHLLVVRDVLTQEIKYFLCHAPVNTSVGELLKVAFSRWRVERCFEDDKSYVGLDHYQGRGYPGLLRHLILSAASLLFLARARKLLHDTYPELTVSQVRQAMSSLVQSWWLEPFSADALIEQTAKRLEYYQRRNAQARKSHSKTRIRRLEELGIDLSTTPRCAWNSE
jgi:SRSO17 transposase